MKKSTLLLIFLLVATQLFAQQWKDVLYLKNGSIVKGTITEQIPDVSYKIQTESGNVFVYPADEVIKIAKEQVQDTRPSNRERNGSFRYDTSSLRFNGKDVVNESGTVFSRQQMEQLLGYDEADRLYHYIHLSRWSIPTAGASLAVCAVPFTIGLITKKTGWLVAGIGMTAACCTLFGVGLSAYFKADGILDDYRTRSFSIQLTPAAIPQYAMARESFVPGLQIHVTF